MRERKRGRVCRRGRECVGQGEGEGECMWMGEGGCVCKG